MTTLHDLATTASQQAETAYIEAITARETIDRLLDSVPVGNAALYQRVLRIQETAVQTINAAWQVKYAAEQLMEDLRKGQS